MHDSPASLPAAQETDIDITDADVDATAAGWWLRQQAADFGPLDAQALADWLEASTAHLAAWDAMQRTATALESIPAADAARIGAMARALTPSPSAATRTSALRRVGIAAAMATVVAMVAWGGAIYFNALPLHSAEYVTARGAFDTLTLPDGSSLELDTASQVQVRYFRSRRELRLIEGQAYLQVSHAPERPMHVDAGALRATVVGTRFHVRHVGGAASVVVDEGCVKVSVRDAHGASAAGTPVHILKAGQAVALRPDGSLTTQAATAADWRAKRLSFDNAPLGDALAEFARYGDSGFVVHDPKVAAMRVSGSFRVDAVDEFAQALPLILPVRLRADGATQEIIPR
ncbi:FecR family protein [Uliginosibacterium sp. H1]|uniref:FecR family protein n=1 Tax=Uliginosibacterium sp. H1 TaxID=3114757 RepID=UPI002E181223|nr:FecR domain-containing protein [Uliginosibacterium sp. H1]